MSPRRSERLRKRREANDPATTVAMERSAAPRSTATRGRSTQRRSGAVERRTALRVPQCNMRETRGRRQPNQTAPEEAPFPPVPIPIEMRSSLQSNNNNPMPTTGNDNNNSDVVNNNNDNNNSSVSAPNNISAENQNEELRRSMMSLVIRIAVTESPSLPELMRRNPMQGMKKLFRILRFLFFRR